MERDVGVQYDIYELLLNPYVKTVLKTVFLQVLLDQLKHLGQVHADLLQVLDRGHAVL
jgi:hypothetical protein